MKIACITPQHKRDYLTETILEGFHQLGHELVVSDPGNGFCDSAMSANDFVTAANKSDVVVAFFGKVRNNAPPRHYLLPQIHVPWVRKAYVDGSEWTSTGWENPLQATQSLVDPTQRRGDPWLNEEMFHLCCHYFKRECYPTDISSRGVIPLPFALRDYHVQDTKFFTRDIDVLCSFSHVKTGMRKEAIDLVEHFKRTMDPAAGLNVVIKSGMSQKEYRDMLARSRVVIDCWGGGDTCDRFWDIVGAGACCLYQRYNIVMPNPFTDWENAVSFSTLSEMSNSLHRLVYGSEAENIGQNGLEHAMRYHTAKNRAQLILDTVFAPR